MTPASGSGADGLREYIHMQLQRQIEILRMRFSRQRRSAEIGHYRFI